MSTYFLYKTRVILHWQLPYFNLIYLSFTFILYEYLPIYFASTVICRVAILIYLTNDLCQIFRLFTQHYYQKKKKKKECYIKCPGSQNLVHTIMFSKLPEVNFLKQGCTFLTKLIYMQQISILLTVDIITGRS